MAINRIEVEEMLARAKEQWRLEIEPDPADPLISRTVAEDMVEKKVEEIKGKLRDLEKSHEELTRKMEEAKSTKGGGKGTNRQALTDRRTFSALPNYEGKHDTYNHWKFKMKVFLNEDQDVKELMAVLEGEKAIPSKDDVGVIFDKVDAVLKGKGEEECNRDWINQQLSQVLCLNLHGGALTSVQNLDVRELKDVNGIIGWCKLAQYCTAMTAQRLQGLAGKVYGPKRIKKYGDVMAAVEEWELNVTRFQEAEGNRILSEQTKIYSIRQLVPEELENDIIRATLTMVSYAAVRAYISEQCAVRRDIKGSGSGPVTMDVNYVKKTLAALVEDEGYGEIHEGDEHAEHECEGENPEENAMEYLLSFEKGYKGGKGFGKGKGKDGGKGSGKFEGTCHFCGMYGHRISDCWKKDAEMKGKGKGKGDGAFGSKGKGKGYEGEAKGYGWKGKGNWKGDGKGAYGKAYGFGNYEEAVKQSAWTLSLSKLKPDKPPGLKLNSTIQTNYRSDLSEANGQKDNGDETREQREKDLKEMERPEVVYPPIGNYSKNQVRKLQGEPPKVRFRPVNKFLPVNTSQMKFVPLNMLTRKHENVHSQGMSESGKSDIGMDSFQVCKMDSGVVMNKSLARAGVEHPACQGPLKVLPKPCGGHYCLGDSATWSHLSAGAFKAPGGCSGVGTCRKVVNPGDKLSTCGMCKPLRKEDTGMKQCEKALSLFFREPIMKELNPAITRVEDGGWQRIRGVMDSGASESVAHPSMCPQYAVTESAGSLAGQKYVSASGDVIPNLGEQLLDIETDEGMSTQIRYQSADVSRPLNSVSEICDAGGEDGQYVVFSRYGGVIMNMETGRRTPFSRVDGIYELGLWVKPPNNESSVFPRLGE